MVEHSKAKNGNVEIALFVVFLKQTTEILGFRSRIPFSILPSPKDWTIWRAGVRRVTCLQRDGKRRSRSRVLGTKNTRGSYSFLGQ